jgi:hypothetical protein
MSGTVLLVLALATGHASQQSAAALWKDPGPIAEKNLAQGPTAADRAPKPPFTFVEEDISGSKPKIKVTDANGVTWKVKFAGNVPSKNEINAEIAASRLMWALGYHVEEHYYVPAGVIEGVKGLERAKDVIDEKGLFRMARFERKPADVERTGRSWAFDQNPFAGTKELSGLLLVTALINNWDNKPENTAIDLVKREDGTVEERYLLSDLGASFGRMAGPPSWTPAPSRWSVEHYGEQPFVKGVNGDSVVLHFEGQVPLPPIPLEHARWFAALAGQLTVDQLRGAFIAAGADPSQADGFATRVVAKIQELQKAIEISRF